MELRLLRSFLVLAEQRHFGRASRALGLSQPALSKQLRQLEEEIGASLLDRSRHGAALTPMGRWFAEEVRLLVRRSDELLLQARRAAGGEVGSLSVGFGIATLELVPALVARFRLSHPGVDVKLREMDTASELEALRRGQLDVGFVRLPVGADLESLPVLEEQMVLVVPGQQGQAGRPASLARFASEPFVMLARERAPRFHDHALELCAAAGFRPRIVQEVSEMPTVLAMVAAGSGVALVPSSVTRMRVGGFSWRTLATASARWTIGAVWLRTGSDRLACDFVQLLRSELSSLRGGRANRLARRLPAQ